MKKHIVISIFCLLLLVVLSGCFKKENKVVQSPREPVEPPAPGLQVVPNPTLLGWLYRGETARCEVSTNEGKIVLKTDNNIIRIEGLSYAFSKGQAPQQATSLTDNEWMYWWTDGEGVKIDLGALKNIEDLPKTIQNKTWEEITQVWQDEETEFECHNIDFVESDFQLPQDIKFIDISDRL